MIKTNAIDAEATCRYCLESGGDGQRLVRPCLCRGTAGAVHLRCLQEAYVARRGKDDYPVCPTCKGAYEGHIAVMCLERRVETPEPSSRFGSRLGALSAWVMARTARRRARRRRR